MSGITLRAGSKTHSHAARGADLYETPPQAVRALLKVEPLPELIWEPACGRGAIVRVLRASGHRVLATDIRDWQSSDQDDCGEAWDFLDERTAFSGFAERRESKAIVTNPPYQEAAQFVRRATGLVPKVVMLLRLAFLESEGRRDVLEGAGLARVHVFRNRLPMMHRDGWAGPRASSAMAFAWFVWERGHGGPPTINRISWEEAK